MKTIYICILFSVIASCSLQPITQTRYSESVEELEATLRHLVHVIPDDMLPRSFSFVNNHYEMVGKNDWTSGFPAGSFWYMYELTGNDFWKEMAIENTKKLEGIQFLTHTHDLGFMVCCSYGNAYRITGEEIYKNEI